MKPNLKAENLERFVLARGKALVCLSGGVDSSVLLAYCARVLGRANTAAFIGAARYMIFPEIVSAKKLCAGLGVEVFERSVELPEILGGNPPNRCYLCKRAIFKAARGVAAQIGAAAVFDGSNADDLAENRLGDAAKAELQIQSPFAECGFAKADIRALAETLGMPETARKPSATCLMTRFAAGRSVSQAELDFVASAEAFVKSLGFGVVRVRDCGGNFELELGAADMQNFTQQAASAVNSFFAAHNAKLAPVCAYRFGRMSAKET